MKLTKKDLKQELKDFEGNVYFEQIQEVNEAGKVGLKRINLTLEKTMIRALTNSPRDVQIDGTEKEKRGWLALMIHEAKSEIEFSSEDIERIRKAIGAYYADTSLIVKVIAVLDPGRVPKG